jgi:hypothetical protein
MKMIQNERDVRDRPRAIVNECHGNEQARSIRKWLNALYPQAL